MDDEASNSGRRAWKYGTRMFKFIVPMFMLIWITCYGYKLAIKTKYTQTSGSGDNCIALLFGVVTAIFGLIYFIIGLTMVAELALDLLAWLRQDDVVIFKTEEKEKTTNCWIFVHSLAIMVSIFMLTWALYYGYKLAVEAQEVVIYNRLAFLIGVISMAFGFIYFIIGLGIVAKYALHLSGRLHQVIAKTDALLERTEMISLEV